MSMSSKTIMAFLCLLLAFFASCSSSKTSVSEDIKGKSSVVLDYNTLSAKVVVSVGNFDLNASLRMKRDSFIFLSLQPFAGVEVARLCVTDKDVFIIDRINKRYSQTSMKDLMDSSSVYVSVGILQSILTNRLFLLKEGREAARLSDFSATHIESSWLLQYMDPGKAFTQEFTTDEQYRVKNAMISLGQEMKRLEYGQFETLENGVLFPMSVKVFLSGPADRGSLFGQSSSMDFAIQYKKLELNKEVNFTNPIPKGYAKVTVWELIRSFQK